MGKIKKGTKCSVIGCKEIAARSISKENAELMGLKVEGVRRSYVCSRHYKEFKKKRKGVQKVERWRWNA